MAYSIQRAVSDGTLKRVVISIKYFDKTDLTVYVNDVYAPVGVLWDWDGSDVLFKANVQNGYEVKIVRKTKFNEPYHIFDKGAMFKDSTIDDNFNQMLFLAQETSEGATATDFYQDLNLHGYRLTKVGQAIDDYDAVPFSQYKADANGAYQSRVAAEAARVAAIAAQASANSSASAASTSASSATASATAAANSATSAATSAANAKASENVVTPLVQQVTKAAADAAQASADAKQAVTDVKSLGAVPLGTVILWALSSAIPAGYLELNGAAFNTTDYPDLAALIPSGVLPDWRDRYVKMAGTETVGSMAAGAMPSHTHSLTTDGAHTHGINDPGHSHTVANDVPSSAGSFNGTAANHGTSNYTPITTLSSGTGISVQSGGSHTHTIGSTGSGTKVEVDRVVAIYIIKAAGKVSDEGLAQVTGIRADVEALKTSKADASNVYQKAEVFTKAETNTQINSAVTSGTSGMVKSVNGAYPDASGNVTISVSGFVAKDQGANNVGSYALLSFTTSGSNVGTNETRAGSQLTFCSVANGGTIYISAGPSGTWRLCGFVGNSPGNPNASLWQRIA